MPNSSGNSDAASVCSYDTESTVEDQPKTVVIDASNPLSSHKEELKAYENEMVKGVYKDYSFITGRNWCITWNYYPENWWERLKSFSNIQYLMGARETGTKNGVPHIQGFIRFKNVRTLGTLNADGKSYHADSLRGNKMTFGVPGEFSSCFFIRESGTPFKWIQYCKKQDKDYLEYGEMKQQGQRTDLQEMADAIVSQSYTFKEIVLKYTQQFIVYSRGMRELHNAMQAHRTKRPRVIYLCGDSGFGKTGYAFREYPEELIYVKVDGSMFFLGYEGEPIVIINEFLPRTRENPHGWIFTEVLQLLDKYKHHVHIKGGHIVFKPAVIYITSPKKPGELYKEKELQQFLRRLDVAVEVHGPNHCVPITPYPYTYYNAELEEDITFTSPVLSFVRDEFKQTAVYKRAIEKRQKQELEALSLASANRPERDNNSDAADG